jgi:hypothetical protein
MTILRYTTEHIKVSNLDRNQYSCIELFRGAPPTIVRVLHTDLSTSEEPVSNFEVSISTSGGLCIWVPLIDALDAKLLDSFLNHGKESQSKISSTCFSLFENTDVMLEGFLHTPYEIEDFLIPANRNYSRIELYEIFEKSYIQDYSDIFVNRVYASFELLSLVSYCIAYNKPIRLWTFHGGNQWCPQLIN